MGVTLLVGGSWLAGTLTWPRRWITVWGERIRDDAGEQRAGLAAGFDNIGRMWFSSDSEREAMEGDPGVVPPRQVGLGPFHLHLLDAKLFMPNGWVPREGGAHLRVRLDQVSAWMVGTLAAPDGARRAGAPPPVPS
jgi:hypothetical protein